MEDELRKSPYLRDDQKGMAQCRAKTINIFINALMKQAQYEKYFFRYLK